MTAPTAKNVWFFPWLAQARELLREKKIRANTFAVLVVLSQFADYGTGRNARPGLQRLSDETGLAPRTVSDALKSGEAVGLIHQDRRGYGNAGAGSASVYSMRYPPRGSRLAAAQATAPAAAPAKRATLPRSDQGLTKKTKKQQGTGKLRTVRRRKPLIDWKDVGLTEELAHERGLTEVDYGNYKFLQNGEESVE